MIERGAVPCEAIIVWFSSRRTDTTNDTESEHDVEKGSGSGGCGRGDGGCGGGGCGCGLGGGYGEGSGGRREGGYCKSGGGGCCDRGGGCCGYPHDAKSKNGKLRLLYECAPMSFIVEQAGGKGSDGHQSVLDIQPTEIHQRVQFYIGSKEEVEKYLA